MVGITDSRVEYSEIFLFQIVPRRVLVIPHEMSVKIPLERSIIILTVLLDYKICGGYTYEKDSFIMHAVALHGGIDRLRTGEGAACEGRAGHSCFSD